MNARLLSHSFGILPDINRRPRPAGLHIGMARLELACAVLVAQFVD